VANRSPDTSHLIRCNTCAYPGPTDQDAFLRFAGSHQFAYLLRDIWKINRIGIIGTAVLYGMPLLQEEFD
jgi:hypothetical protein